MIEHDHTGRHHHHGARGLILIHRHGGDGEDHSHSLIIGGELDTLGRSIHGLEERWGGA